SVSGLGNRSRGRLLYGPSLAPPAAPSPSVPYSVPANAVGVHFARSRKVARCWRVVRTDGTTHRFTDWDVPIWVASELFLPSDAGDADDNHGGVAGAAHRRQTGLREQTAQIRGVLSASSLTHDDFVAVRYDGATITELWVDARWPWLRFNERTFLIDTVEFHDGNAFEAGLVSQASAKLRQKRGIVATRTCRHHVFDALCTKPHTDGVTPSLKVDEWTIGFDAASWCSVSAVEDADYKFTLTLPHVDIASITVSPLFNLTWFNVIGDVWQVTTAPAHNVPAGNYFDAIFTGVAGATGINGQTVAVLSTGSNQFTINMGSFSGTPSSGQARIGVT